MDGRRCTESDAEGRFRRNGQQSRCRMVTSASRHEQAQDNDMCKSSHCPSARLGCCHRELYRQYTLEVVSHPGLDELPLPRLEQQLTAGDVAPVVIHHLEVVRNEAAA